MTGDEIEEHNTIMFARVVILSEKIMELEQKLPHAQGEMIHDIQSAIKCLKALTKKYQQKIISKNK